MSVLNQHYLKLCMTTLFYKVTENPLFKAFERYSTVESRTEKIKAYASFVNEIYKNGGSLTSLVCRLVFEDENVYVKARARGAICEESILTALERELSVFESFAALTPVAFKEDMNLSYVSPFSSRQVSLVTLYEERMREIAKHGYGVFSSYPMFRLDDDKNIVPIVSADKTDLDKFIGYADERARVVENTEAFIAGKPAANVLLSGDAGTGKSSTVKAIANHFFSEGIRLIELRKDQLSCLPFVMGRISENPLKFIIFIDDLSFNKNDDNFSMLKAALEGSASTKADNAVIYATSNRRHIVKETFSEREGDDVHRNDTVQELLSLSERFGLVVHFSRPDKTLYLEIVFALADRYGIKMDKDELAVKAEAFALRRGVRSARCAEQFIEGLTR